ncbi:MAG: DeoR family transcriptional regulator, partial [Imperialibacter sp.]
LNERQQAVLEFVKKRKAVRMSEIEEAFKTHSRNTLKKDMAYLVNEGLLLKIGERKGTRYHYQE